MSVALLLLGMGGAAGIINGAIVASAEASPALFSVLNTGAYTDTSLSFTGNWVTPATTTIAAQYQVKVDATSGSFSSGTTGTWLDCSSHQSWTKSSGSVTFTISFREKATGIVRSVQTGLVLQGL